MFNIIIKCIRFKSETSQNKLYIEPFTILLAFFFLLILFVASNDKKSKSPETNEIKNSERKLAISDIKVSYNGEETKTKTIREFRDLTSGVPYSFQKSFNVQSQVLWGNEFEVGGSAGLNIPTIIGQAGLTTSVEIKVASELGVSFSQGTGETHEVVLNPDLCKSWDIIVTKTHKKGAVSASGYLRSEAVRILTDVRLKALNKCDKSELLATVSYKKSL